MNLHN